MEVKFGFPPFLFTVINSCRSATNLSLHIRSESRKPSISVAFSVIRIHLHPCPSTGDRLEMWERTWENWWHGKALRYRCESSKTSKPAAVIAPFHNQLASLERQLGPIEHRAPGALLRYANNPRRHPEKQLVALEASIREFGFLLPVLIDEESMTTRMAVGASRLRPLISPQRLIADRQLATNLGLWNG